MSRLSRTLVGTALGYLILGMLGGIFLALPGVTSGWGPALRPTHVHWIVVGWLTQLVFGVALWLFPRRRQLQHQSRLAWAGFVLLNAGIVLRSVAEPALVMTAAPAWARVAAASAVLQWGAIVLFVICLWPRIQGR